MLVQICLVQPTPLLTRTFTKSPKQPSTSSFWSPAACATTTLLFVVAWSLFVPEMEWTATGYRARNAALDTRLGVTLVLFLVELPLAVGLRAPSWQTEQSLSQAA